jgi:predicted  nucleic acid-binding Zn-ribbon protein
MVKGREKLRQELANSIRSESEQVNKGSLIIATLTKERDSLKQQKEEWRLLSIDVAKENFSLKEENERLKAIAGDKEFLDLKNEIEFLKEKCRSNLKDLVIKHDYIHLLESKLNTIENVLSDQIKGFEEDKEAFAIELIKWGPGLKNDNHERAKNILFRFKEYLKGN